MFRLTARPSQVEQTLHVFESNRTVWWRSNSFKIQLEVLNPLREKIVEDRHLSSFLQLFGNWCMAFKLSDSLPVRMAMVDRCLSYFRRFIPCLKTPKRSGFATCFLNKIRSRLNTIIWCSCICKDSCAMSLPLRCYLTSQLVVPSALWIGWQDIIFLYTLPNIIAVNDVFGHKIRIAKGEVLKSKTPILCLQDPKSVVQSWFCEIFFSILLHAAWVLSKAMFFYKYFS